MKATIWEFRLRVWIMFAMVAIGFWSPWLAALHGSSAGSRTSTWLWLGLQLAGFGISSTIGLGIVTIATILVAALATLLRVWGTAYLGIGTVNHGQMQASKVLVDGPYRHLRNPLYLGSFLVFVAISVLMPPSGAAVSLVLLAMFLFRLILGEEAFLAPRLGASYATYRRAVPRLIPSPWPRVAASGQTPNWGRGLLGEIFPIGVLVTFVGLSWQYNAQLLEQGVLVCFGLSMIVRAVVVPKTSAEATEA